MIKKESIGDIVRLIALIVVFTVLGMCVVDNYVMGPLEKQIKEEVYQELLDISGMEIVENAEIESPPLLLVIEKFDTFLSYCEDKQVYKIDNSYYIFNDDFTIAYRYTISYNRTGWPLGGIEIK